MFFTEHPEVKDWYNKSEKTIYWPNGSTTEFSYLQHTDDVYTYQGREYEDISVDEVTQHDEEVFKILRSSNRTTNDSISPTMFLTGNPGGIGHAWVKRIFVDKEYTKNETPQDFGFVQAMVKDNLALMDADPAYIKRLMDLPDDKRRAYLEGDWDIFAGQVFHDFKRSIHVINPILPSKRFPVSLWMDWGYSEKSAFAAYLSAEVEEQIQGVKFTRVLTFKEFYGNQRSPDSWAEEIYEFCKKNGYEPYRGFTDPAMHSPETSGATAIATLMMEYWEKKTGDKWLHLEKGQNSGPASRVNRIGMLHNWLSIAPDGLPYWIITSNCANLIRTLPKLVYDDTRVDEWDTTQEDHPADSVTYGFSRIKFIKPIAGVGGVSKKEIFYPWDTEGKSMGIDLDKFKYAKDENSGWVHNV